jgi:lysophospholipase L1-like esterase
MMLPSFRSLAPGLLLLGALLRAQTPPAPPDASVAAAPVRALNPALPTLFIAGDSTAATGSGKVQGWGQPFASFFDPAKINVANRARGGRSSRTFITDGSWSGILAQLKAGDTVLIQFGHNDLGALNDEPPPPLRARGTIPGLGEETKEIDNVVTKKHEVVHTFGWYMRKMIADVQAKGATPIVVSLTVRDNWADGKVERGPGQYSVWSAQIAQAAGLGFVDLTQLVADEYERRGPDRVKTLFPGDSTHTGAEGAELNAAMVVSGLRALKGSPFDRFLSPKGHSVTPAVTKALP